MIYLIGGVTKSGKSVISKKIVTYKKLQYFNLDHIMRSALNSKIDFKFDKNKHNDYEKAEKLWCII